MWSLVRDYYILLGQENYFMEVHVASSATFQLASPYGEPIRFITPVVVAACSRIDLYLARSVFLSEVLAVSLKVLLL
jgi:hypothetical protein